MNLINTFVKKKPFHMRIIILPSPFSRQGLASTMVATRVLNSSFVQLDMAASPRPLKRWNGRIFGGWWWGFHVARWKRWNWVYPCSTALRCWDCWIFCYSRFCCKKKDLGERVEIWQKFDIQKYSGERLKCQRSKGLVQDLHMLVCPINICLYTLFF